MKNIKIYKPKALKSENKWLAFSLKCGVKLVARDDGIWLEGMESRRGYYLLHDPKGVEPLAICTLKRGEKILDHTFYSPKPITQSEYDTYKEFDLFPELQHQKQKGA